MQDRTDWLIFDRWHYNGEQSDSNPYLGHALERSWAQIMGCLDGSIAEKCKDDVFDVDKCQVRSLTSMSVMKGIWLMTRMVSALTSEPM